MNSQNIKSAILELYCNSAKSQLPNVAEQYGVSLNHCEREWQMLEKLGEYFKLLPQHQPSQMSINKILAHANERAEQLRKQSFWHMMFKPVYSAALVLIVGLLSFNVWQNAHQQKSTVALIQQQNFSPIENARRVFTSPFGTDNMGANYNLPAKSPYLNTQASPASLGNQDTDSFLTQNINVHDVELLFFRAAKSEKLGYYQEALNDYLNILKNNAQNEYQKTVTMAVARCYERLGDKQTALSFLESYEQHYGTNTDLVLWKDQLKSETF